MAKINIRKGAWARAIEGEGVFGDWYQLLSRDAYDQNENDLILLKWTTEGDKEFSEVVFAKSENYDNDTGILKLADSSISFKYEEDEDAKEEVEETSEEAEPEAEVEVEDEVEVDTSDK